MKKLHIIWLVCNILFVADVAALKHYEGQPEAAIIAFPLLGAMLLAAACAVRLRGEG
jgi:hypothetical protein